MGLPYIKGSPVPRGKPAPSKPPGTCRSVLELEDAHGHPPFARPWLPVPGLPAPALGPRPRAGGRSLLGRWAPLQLGVCSWFKRGGPRVTCRRAWGCGTRKRPPSPRDRSRRRHRGSDYSLVQLPAPRAGRRSLGSTLAATPGPPAAASAAPAMGEEDYYLELCERPVHFEKATPVNCVFFDEANKQVGASPNPPPPGVRARPARRPRRPKVAPRARAGRRGPGLGPPLASRRRAGTSAFLLGGTRDQAPPRPGFLL